MPKTREDNDTTLDLQSYSKWDQVRILQMMMDKAPSALFSKEVRAMCFEELYMLTVAHDIAVGNGKTTSDLAWWVATL